jgi:uncharacterized protein (DUF1800 family)
MAPTKQTPAYIGQGAVVKALLLDPEARDTSFITDPAHGKLQKSFLRVTQLLRAFRYSVIAGTLPYDFGGTFTENTRGQFSLGALSVLNFYSPDYSPAGPIGTLRQAAARRVQAQVKVAAACHSVCSRR